MDRLTTPALKKVVRSVVRKADKRGDIDRGAFTLKVAKQEIADELDISTEVLNEKPWKQTVKDLVYEAIENVDTLKNSPVKPPPQAHTKPEQDIFTGQGRTKKELAQGKKTKGKVVVDSDDDAGPSAQKMNGRSAMKDRKPKIVVSDDDIMLTPAEVEDADDSLDEHPPPPPRSRKRPISNAGSDESEADSPPRRSGGKNGKVKKKQRGADADGDVRVGKIKVKPSPKALTSTSAALSAPVVEDERVKELKSIVVACGVRKQWKKEFQGMDSANQQVAHLKGLLTSLGMTGRPTKAKAKSIKEKRELAAELGDVLEFEAKRGLGITNSRRSDTNTTRSPGTEGNE